MRGSTVKKLRRIKKVLDPENRGTDKLFKAAWRKDKDKLDAAATGMLNIACTVAYAKSKGATE